MIYKAPTSEWTESGCPITLLTELFSGVSIVEFQDNFIDFFVIQMQSGTADNNHKEILKRQRIMFNIFSPFVWRPLPSSSTIWWQVTRKFAQTFIAKFAYTELILQK